jgi:hypothetical protein
VSFLDIDFFKRYNLKRKIKKDRAGLQPALTGKISMQKACLKADIFSAKHSLSRRRSIIISNFTHRDVVKICF